ncbi:MULTISPECIES: adenylate/guanylate cyclase domain-containing protein [unclassified Treponema]|uniref:adenylate/guanylate cyclase domain-containing protein n=1 Tax=unclassified Treponema TaxID=2638727 RepID=UPI0020A2A7AF|nr:MULTISPECIES: adenylate/guanylate cyclase domain-containing protein [unclassified Treponema]UTC66754.1 adenylate/guanylate cyclase domain-containing protein [Treponema sp. OMZ 789]UTC69486.1 adenylate/guanylate cyclase domain-containing protein [Treponema sp. OMZ 790]UTC72200.1 adenylate/guanylate cyclase domain-containing protein [Treponema sp. OMZ 791]
MNLNLKYNQNQEAADKIAASLSALQEEKLFHIDVYGLAEELNLNKETILNIFIQGVYDGFFTIDWIYHCPTCGGVAHETLSIHEAVSENYCPACQKNFNNTLDDNIEVFFSIHPNIIPLKPSLKETYLAKIENDVNTGNYLTWKKTNSIKGIDLIQNNLYRELMGSDVLIAEQSLQIMKTAILFTDIKGSTFMYSELGDAKAFALVREHFRILFDVIKKFNGVPVKTIGDAIMGVFMNSKNAVDASIEIQKELHGHYKNNPEIERIEVKIGIHAGPALVVTLNNRLDYFGTSVNMAARIQNAARPNEVVISEELFNDKGIQKSIAEITDKVQRQRITFKGMKEESTVYHIRVE